MGWQHAGHLVCTAILQISLLLPIGCFPEKRALLSISGIYVIRLSSEAFLNRDKRGDDSYGRASIAARHVCVANRGSLLLPYAGGATGRGLYHAEYPCPSSPGAPF